MMVVANSKKTAGKKRNSWPKGVSGNPKGAPRKGESWAEIIKRVGDMTPVEAADHANAIASKLRQIGGALTLKEAVIVRVYAALLFEPNASLLNAFMDRAEGKVINPVDVTSGGKEILSTQEVYDSVIRKLGLVEQSAETSESTDSNSA